MIVMLNAYMILNCTLKPVFYDPRGRSHDLTFTPYVDPFVFVALTLRLMLVTLCTLIYSPNLLFALLCAYITRRLDMLNFTICYPHLNCTYLILTRLDSGLFTWVIHALLDLIDCIDFYLYTY